MYINSTEEQDFLFKLLEQQLAILSRIDSRSSEQDIKNRWYNVQNKNKLLALTMSKEIANCCYCLLLFLRTGKNKDKLLKLIEVVENKKYNHPYELSAKWNIIYAKRILENGLKEVRMKDS